MHRGIVFDFDGVIINSFELQKYALQESYREVVGEGTPNIDLFFSYSGDSLSNIFRYMGFPSEMVDIYNQVSTKHIEQIKIYPGIVDLLKNLHDIGIVCGLCTGKNRKRTLQIIDYFKLNSFFEEIVCSDDVQNPKPDPESLLKIVDSMNFDLDQVIMVGDAPNDIVCAKRCGVQSIGVTWGEVPAEILVREHPTYIANSVDELQQLIFNESHISNSKCI